MSEPLVVKIGPGFPEDGTFKLRVTPEHAEELTEELRAAGFEPDAALEHAAGAELLVFLVAFTQAGGLDGLANILSTVLSRHDGKRFVVRGPNNVEVEAEGYSVRQVRQLLGAAAEYVDEQDATWKRLTPDSDGGDALPAPESDDTGPGED